MFHSQLRDIGEVEVEQNLPCRGTLGDGGCIKRDVFRNVGVNSEEVWFQVKILTFLTSKTARMRRTETNKLSDVTGTFSDLQMLLKL